MLIWFLILLWPFLSTVVLLLSTLVRPDLTFTSELDMAFFAELTAIVLSHVVAFIAIPLLIMKLLKLSRKEFFAFKIVGVFVIFLQTFLRAIANTTLEPVTSTPGIMPTTLNDIVTTVTILALVGVFAITLYVLKPKKLKNSKSVH